MSIRADGKARKGVDLQHVLLSHSRGVHPLVKPCPFINQNKQPPLNPLHINSTRQSSQTQKCVLPKVRQDNQSWGCGRGLCSPFCLYNRMWTREVGCRSKLVNAKLIYFLVDIVRYMQWCSGAYAQNIEMFTCAHTSEHKTGKPFRDLITLCSAELMLIEWLSTALLSDVLAIVTTISRLVGRRRRMRGLPSMRQRSYPGCVTKLGVTSNRSFVKIERFGFLPSQKGWAFYYFRTGVKSCRRNLTWCGWGHCSGNRKSGPLPEQLCSEEKTRNLRMELDAPYEASTLQSQGTCPPLFNYNSIRCR